jgi:hypothetical protein
MSETVRETLNRVMSNMGFYDNKNNSNNLRAYNQETLNKAVNGGSWAVTPQPTYESLILNHQNYDNQLNSNWNGVGVDALTGAGEGIIAAGERYLNTLSGGIYGDAIDGYTARQNHLQQQAEQAGVGKLSRLANDGVDWTARGMQATLLSKINKFIK